MLKLNRNIQRIWGEVMHKHADVPADVMVTVSSVETRPNLRSSTVWLYVFPVIKGEEVLEQLKPQMYKLQGLFNEELQTNPLPRIILRLDHGADYAESITKKLDSLDE